MLLRLARILAPAAFPLYAVDPDVPTLEEEAPADEEVTEPAEEEPEDVAVEEAPAEPAPEEEGELVVTLGDEPAPEQDETRAPDWVRDLRKANREKDRRIRELEAAVQRTAPAPQQVTLGEKPTLAAVDYDEEKYAAQMEEWHARKAAIETQRRQQEQAQQAEQQRWQTRIESVNTAAQTLKVRDYEDASAVFEDTFSLVQQGIIVGGPEDAKASAILRYALGKNPKKAKELAAIQDPVRFTFAVAKLESQLKVEPRKAAPAPDRPVRSAVAGAAAVDSTLARLRAEAERTGDYSAVTRYKSEQRKKNAG